MIKSDVGSQKKAKIGKFKTAKTIGNDEMQHRTLFGIKSLKINIEQQILVE